MFHNLLTTIGISATILSAVRAEASIDYTALGPSTSLASKSTICSVLDYGGVADGTTDVGPAILEAFSSCASAGGATLYIPPGNYSIATGVILKGGSAYALKIDGLITLTSDGDFDGNAIVLEDSNDIEVYSSNGLGAINGQGYIARRDSTGQNARLFRFISCTEISFHDIILVDAPAFHLVMNNVENSEVYHVTIRGPDIGGSDGIDIICDGNCYFHDIEVTNRDECISVKSPSNNVLIEEMYCNHSGGMSIGSLTADVDADSTGPAVSNITMRNIYTYSSTQALMIKTFPGGTGAEGYVTDCLFENFWSYDVTYGLDIDQYWEDHSTPNTGAVALSSLVFRNWTGTVDDGVSRAPIVIRGSDQVGLTNITLEDFNMWTVNNDQLDHICKNVYGTGYCARAEATAGATPTFTSTLTVTDKPKGYTPPVSPAWGIEGYGSTLPIPIYTPAVMWPVNSTDSTFSSDTSDDVVKAKVASVVVSPTSAKTASSPKKASATSKTTKVASKAKTTKAPRASSSMAYVTSSVAVLPIVDVSGHTSISPSTLITIASLIAPLYRNQSSTPTDPSNGSQPTSSEVDSTIRLTKTLTRTMQRPSSSQGPSISLPSASGAALGTNETIASNGTTPVSGGDNTVALLKSLKTLLEALLGKLE